MNIKQGILILLLLLRVTSVKAQFYTVASVSNIDRFNQESVFPVLKSKKHQSAADRINTYLHLTVLDQVYENDRYAYFEHVFPPEDEYWGQSNFDFQVMTNNELFFSIAIMYESTGAYTESFVEYYTFSSFTGEHLTLNDFFAETPLIDVSSIVKERFAKRIKSYLPQIDKKEEDGDAKYEMYEECLSYIESEDVLYNASFYIKDTSMVFTRERCSNHMMAALDDLWTFETALTLNELGLFFNEETSKALAKNYWESNGDVILNDKILKGSIRKKYKITARIQFRPMKDGCQELSGVYWYDKIKTIITLNGEVDEDGNFELIEYFDGVATGVFKGKMKANSLIGFWSSGKGTKKMPFILDLK